MKCFISFIALLIVSLAHASSGTVQQAAGTWNYSVPLEVPEFHRITPQLALHYNSSNPNGIAGMGWTVAGFSEITRSPIDAVAGINKFFLDGQELIECAKTTGFSPSCRLGGTHATKIESYLRIAYLNGDWHVWRADGTKLTYASKQKNRRGTIVRWGLTQIADTSGNIVNYEWECQGSDGCYPKRLRYNPTYPTVVTFYYTNRSDPVWYQNSGDLGVLRWKLQSVDVQVRNNRLRLYWLNYETSALTQRSLLTRITEYGTNASVNAGRISGSHLPPIVFSYSQPNLWALVTAMFA